MLPCWRLLAREGAGEEERCSDFQSSESESSHGSMARGFGRVRVGRQDVTNGVVCLEQGDNAPVVILLSHREDYADSNHGGEELGCSWVNCCVCVQA